VALFAAELGQAFGAPAPAGATTAGPARAP
jgi:hypothetical protein